MTQVAIMAQSRPVVRCFRKTTAPIKTQAGARFWNQIVFVGEPLTMAVKNVQFISTKQHIIGIIAQ
jgi:hypothetical protein